MSDRRSDLLRGVLAAALSRARSGRDRSRLRCSSSVRRHRPRRLSRNVEGGSQSSPDRLAAGSARVQTAILGPRPARGARGGRATVLAGHHRHRDFTCRRTGVGRGAPLQFSTAARRRRRSVPPACGSFTTSTSTRRSLAVSIRARGGCADRALGNSLLSSLRVHHWRP